MKKIFILLFCLLGSLLNAQNYQNICTPGITFFKDSTGNIKVYRQDSVYLPGNNDTIFISYRTIRPFFINGCYDTTNGSILGRRIYKKQDGTFYFFNWNHDTLILKTQAILNESWKFCNLAGGRIDATVVNLAQDTVLGTPDSIKIISFQAKDINGINIPHFLNLKTMRLSRHYGIVKTFDLYFMPDTLINDTSSYLLAGKTNSSSGIQNLTWQEIYNYDVGDEFHYLGNQTFWGYGSSNWKIIKRVLGKEVSGNMDSVKYTMEFCKIRFLIVPPTPSIETTYDTIVESYDFTTLLNDETIQELPEKLSLYNQIAPRFGRFIRIPGRQTQEYQDWSYSLTGNCWSFPFEPFFTTYQYSEGLGITSRFHMEVDLGGMITWQEDLVYYKKGSEIWGTPIAPNCITLVPVEEKTKAVLPDMSINPNPVETVAEISYEGISQPGLHYILYNEFGQQVRIQEIYSNPFLFDRSGLPEGLCIISVLDDKNNILARKKIMLK